MSKFTKKVLLLLGSLAAIGAFVMFFLKRQEGENDLFEEDDDFDDVTMPAKSVKDSARSYINLV